MTFKGVIKAILAIAIIVAGAAIGWSVATSTNPYAPGNNTAVVAANATAVPNTPVPTFTPANPASTTPGAGGQGAGGQAQGTPGTGRTGTGTGGQRARPITGTVESYDATSKVLIVKASDGTSQKFQVGSARLVKNDKISADDFGKLATSGIVIVTGDKNSDGSYNARNLTAVDPTAALAGGGNPFGGGGNGATGGNGGTGANGTAGATGGNAAPGGNAGGGNGFGGANAPVVIRGGTLDGKTFSGASFAGDTIKVNLTDSTTLTKQATATADDFKAGATVSVTAAAAAQSGTPADAQTVTLS